MYLEEADGLEFCCAILEMLVQPPIPDSETDVTVNFGEATMKKFFRAIDKTNIYAAATAR
jgi:hypothetical protein